MAEKRRMKKRSLEYLVVIEGKGVFRVMEAREENTKSRWKGLPLDKCRRARAPTEVD